MVSDAEKYKAEDEAAATRIAAKNGLESYAYNLRNSLNEEAFAAKLDDSDKSTLNSAIDEAISWLDANQEGTKEEYEDRQKELEGVANPIMQKAYGAGGAPGGGMPGGGMPGGAPGATPDGGAGDGPSVEEVD